MFSLSIDILKGMEGLKAAKHRRLVRISFKKMRRLNNHNRLKVSDAKKKHKSQSVHAFNPPIPRFCGQRICDGEFF